jgi:hypothetical protein
VARRRARCPRPAAGRSPRPSCAGPARREAVRRALADDDAAASWLILTEICLGSRDARSHPEMLRVGRSGQAAACGPARRRPPGTPLIMIITEATHG